MANTAHNGELPDPQLGNGPVWRLALAKGTEDVACIETRKRCEILLEQALSCSKFADVRFVFQDGSMLGGHWGMLCGVCKVFEAMYYCGMEEAHTKEVRAAGFTQESFRGFLEWLYLGAPGKEMATADGRQVWLLAEKHHVEGIKEWLVRECLDEIGVCAAAQYALEGDGEGRDDLLNACRGKGASLNLAKLDEECLRGLSAHALCEVLHGHRCGGGGVFEGERAMERFRVIERWAKVNGISGSGDGVGGDGIGKLIDAVDLSRIPAEFIANVVRPSGLVNADRVWDVRAPVIGGGSVADVRLHLLNSYGSLGDGHGQFRFINHIAVSVDSDPLRLAVADERQRVLVFDVDSGQCLLSIGSLGEGDGQFKCPHGVAFNPRGDLIVSDNALHRIQVFDRNGAHVRTFGSNGQGDGQFSGPGGVAVNAQGDIIVCDQDSDRVQIFREDGTFVHKFGSRGTGAGHLDLPSGLAVGPDGSIVVVDHGNARVQVFNMLGSHILTIGSEGEGRGQFLNPFGVCVGSQGDIFVSDWGRKDAQVFNRSGEFVQSIGCGGDSDCDISVRTGIAVDRKGRVFVSNRKGEGDDTVANVAMLGLRIP